MQWSNLSTNITIALSLVALLILAANSIIESKKNYGHTSAECSSSYCYDDSSSQSCLTPESWKLVPCRRGISNECRGVHGMQSPINFKTGSGGYNDDSDDSIGDDCISLSSNNGGNSADLRTASFEAGDCNFIDLTTILKNQKSIQTDYPSTCNKPKVRIPHIEKVNTYEDWELIQFHFHVRSEHTFDDRRFGGEFHLVHKSLTTGKLLVIGVPVQKNDGDDDNLSSLDISQVVEPIIEACEIIAKNVLNACNTMRSIYAESHELPFKLAHSNISLNNSVEQDWNIYELLNMGNGYYGDQYDDYNSNILLGVYAYMGSLTTPPCSTGVQWYVLDKPMAMEPSQLQRLYTLIGGWSCPTWPSCEYEVANYIEDESLGTFRPTQASGNNAITHFCAL